MVKIRDLGISAIPGNGYRLGEKCGGGTGCEICDPQTTCGDPSGGDKDKDKDKDKGQKKYAFSDAAVGQLRQDLRHQLDNRV